MHGRVGVDLVTKCDLPRRLDTTPRHLVAFPLNIEKNRMFSIKPGEIKKQQLEYFHEQRSNGRIFGGTTSHV